MAGLVRVLISPELIAGWFETGAETRVRCLTGLPTGAKPVRVAVERESTWPVVAITFEHEALSDVPLGGLIPELIPVFETLE